jgi:hypothetical protein
VIRKLRLKQLSANPTQFIYENPAAKPMASFTDTPLTVVPVKYYTNRIRLLPNGRTGVILLRIAPIRGYSIMKSDGTAATVTLTENGVLIPVTTKERTVDVIYRSKSLNVGILLLKSAFVLFISVFIVVQFFMRYGKRKCQKGERKSQNLF